MVRLLIVDDETELVKNIAGYLNSFPGEFEVMPAGSAEEAENVLKGQEVDLLLTDVRLPGLDGIELVRRALQLHPGLPVVVMTAFSSQEVRQLAMEVGALRYVEKPLDLEELRHLLLEAATRGKGWSGRVGGLEIFDLAQLLALTGKSKAIRISCGREKGVLVFEQGQLVHASTGSLQGCEAFFAMAGWEAASFDELAGAKARKYPPNITMSTTNLMLEAVRLRDEALERSRAGEVFSVDGAMPGEVPPAQANLWPSNEDFGREKLGKERSMAIKEHLGQLQGVEGFIGAAVFSPTGDMLESIVAGNVDIKTVGQFANNALLNAQKATDQMGVGRGNLVQIRAPQAVVLMRCLNEATDFAATAAGKAHFHTVAVMQPEGNIGMAVMMLDRIVTRVADELR